MNNYMKNKTLGFYFTVAASVLAAISLILYRPVTGALTLVYELVAAAIVVELLLVILSKVLGNKGIFNLASSICAVLMGGGFIMSFSTQLDAIGYVLSGLYSMNQIIPFVTFAGFAGASMVLYIIASFMDLGK